MITIDDAAKLCHEANRTFCEMIGDNTQVSYEEAAQWQRDSAISGVRFQLDNPDLPASASHENWMKEKLEQGWVFGEQKNSHLKTHPCLVDYSQLPVNQQIKDHLFKSIVAALAPFIKA